MAQSVYEELIRLLIEAKIPSPRLEARLLIAAAAGTDADNISSDTVLSDDVKKRLEKMAEERLKHKPLDKIVGHKAFYKYDFIVNENVLSPRPDTEILVMAAADIICRHSVRSVLDMGTGSGCILLSLLKDFPDLHGTGIDISDTALQTARSNLKKLDINLRQADFFQTDWFNDNILSVHGAPFDLIVSNPPYIPGDEINSLDTEVKDFDPKLALDGGPDGLKSYRRIAEISPFLLSSKGFILLECGAGQAQDIIQIFTLNGFEHIKTLPDLAGIERCIIFRKKDCI